MLLIKVNNPPLMQHHILQLHYYVQVIVSSIIKPYQTFKENRPITFEFTISETLDVCGPFSYTLTCRLQTYSIAASNTVVYQYSYFIVHLCFRPLYILHQPCCH